MNIEERIQKTVDDFNKKHDWPANILILDYFLFKELERCYQEGYWLRTYEIDKKQYRGLDIYFSDKKDELFVARK